MIVGLVILFGVIPALFLLTIPLAFREQAVEQQKIYEFERGWGPHDEHEWVRHTVTHALVCRFCPMPYYASAPHAHFGADAQTTAGDK